MLVAFNSGLTWDFPPLSSSNAPFSPLASGLLRLPGHFVRARILLLSCPCSRFSRSTASASLLGLFRQVSSLSRLLLLSSLASDYLIFSPAPDCQC